MHVEDKTNKIFSQEILYDVNPMLEIVQATNDKAEDEIVYTITESCAHFWEVSEDTINSIGFDLMYN